MPNFCCSCSNQFMTIFHTFKTFNSDISFGHLIPTFHSDISFLSLSLHLHYQFQTFTDYIDGARLYLEADGADSLKENAPGVREIKIYFAEFLRLLIDGFTRKFKLIWNLKYFTSQNFSDSLSTALHVSLNWFKLSWNT